MSNELMTQIDEAQALVSFSEEDGLQPIVDDMKTKVEGFEHDMATVKGRDRTRSMAHSISTRKTTLDKLGKGLTVEWQAKTNAVNANRKSVRDQLDELKKQARAPLTEWENAEEKRVDGIRKEIDMLKGCATVINEDGTFKSVEVLKESLRVLSDYVIDDSFQEFSAEALTEKYKAINYLKENVAEREAHEAEQAELSRLREEEAARKQKERDDKLKAEAAAEATKKAEDKAKEDKAQSERDKQAAIQDKKDAEAAQAKATQKAIEAQQALVAAEKKAKLDAKKAAEDARLDEIKRQEQEVADEKAARALREANEKHVEKVNSLAIVAMMGAGIKQDAATKLVGAIASGDIPGVTINY